MLTPDCQELVQSARAAPGPRLADLDEHGQAAYLAKLRDSFPVPAGKPRPDIVVGDIEAPSDSGGVRLRTYRPQAEGEKLPAILLCHGGGWVAGSPRHYDALSEALALQTRCEVISVAYRLAPEHRYPAAANDVYDALSWVCASAESLQLDAKRISIAGLSAGGNLAAAAVLRARDEGTLALHGQVLIYPVLDDRMATDSHTRMGSGYVTSHEQIAWFWQQYVPDPRRRAHPYAAPLRASDLTSLPPTLIVAAEYDPLHDEAKAYASALSSAGVKVRFQEALGQIHGFLSLFPEGEAAVETLHQIVGWTQ